MRRPFQWQTTNYNYIIRFYMMFLRWWSYQSCFISTYLETNFAKKNSAKLRHQVAEAEAATIQKLPLPHPWFKVFLPTGVKVPERKARAWIGGTRWPVFLFLRSPKISQKICIFSAIIFFLRFVVVVVVVFSWEHFQKFSLVLSLNHSTCPWSWEGLSSKSRFLASIFFLSP